MCPVIPLSLVAVALAGTPSPMLDIKFEDDASFRISVAGDGWLGSAPIRTFAAGSWRTLNRTGAVHSKGADALGVYTLVNVSWVDGGGGGGGKGLVLHTSLKAYSDGSTAIFTQQLPFGATGTNASNPVLPQGVREYGC